MRLGIIGAGYVVESYHLPVLAGMKELRVEWICDRDLKKAETLAKSFGIPRAFADASSGGDVDLVLVAVPVGARREVMELVFSRGWHAFCEKPMAKNHEEHQWMLEVAEKKRLLLGIGLVRRFYDSTQNARRLIESGTLGPLSSIIAGEGGRVLRTGREAGWYQADPKASGGGVLAERGPHLVDQAFTIAGATQFRIDRSAQKRMPETGLEFETAVSGHLRTKKQFDVRFSFMVTRSTDIYNGLVFRCENGEIRIGLEPDAATEIYGSDKNLVATIAPTKKGPAALSLAIRKEWIDFVSAIKAGVRESDTAILTTRLIDECYQGDKVLKLVSSQ